MSTTRYTKKLVLEMTREVVHNFFDRKKETVYQPMSEHLMWIGDYYFQWAENLAEFINLTTKEMDSSQMFILDEEYKLLKKTGNVWIVYGKYTNKVILEDGTVVIAYNRGTFIWEKQEDELKLIHIHSSSAQDALYVEESEEDENKDFMTFLAERSPKKMEGRLEFSGVDGLRTLLNPYEIIYLKALKKHTEIHTKDQIIEVTGLISQNSEKLPLNFVSIHKSYVVNRFYVNSVSRYEAMLKNGESIPMSKQRYMALRRELTSPLE